jgi:hypothetical protein
MRRAKANYGLNNRKDVVDDLRKVLKLEPQNKDAIEMMSQDEFGVDISLFFA